MRIRVSITVAALLLSAATALAQTRVRVKVDQTIIWRPGSSAVAAVVKAGTVLTAVAQRGMWYEVILPGREDAPTTTGLVATGQVEVIDGPPPPQRPLVPSGSQGPPRRTQARSRLPPPRLAVRGVGQVGYEWFRANRSFDAVFGSSGGPMFGGGADVRIHDRLFFQGTFERFHSTGERAFVSGGSVFKLGVPQTVTIMPLEFTAGYRFPRRSATAYAGGGIGRYFFRERSPFASSSENVDEQFVSYHALAGIEWRGDTLFSTAFEVEYTHVPDALGAGGVSAAFGEHNLGGIKVRVKIAVGR